MDYVIIAVVALLVSGLTFFSGFGLGTLLMPAFALFFPIEVAVAATAIVHLANNIFKLILIGKHAVMRIVLKFAVPAAIAAAFGALVLNYVSDLDYIASYTIGGKEFFIMPVKLIIAVLMVVFALLELLPFVNDFNIKEKYIPVGGVLSGFFGGISGHQGALRTAFLVHTGLDKKALIGTMVTSSVIVDISRLVVYGITFFSAHFTVLQSGNISTLIIVGTIAAFIGAFIGRQLLEKVTLKHIQVTVAVMLLILAVGLASGII
jgi:uncharacterized membrane protein YfcA